MEWREELVILILANIMLIVTGLIRPQITLASGLNFPDLKYTTRSKVTMAETASGSFVITPR